MLPQVFPLLSASSAVRALIGSRAYRHGSAPQDVVAPYVTWFVVTGNPENTLEDLPRVDRYEVQLDCWSVNTGEGPAQVETLAKAVRDALEPYAYMTAVVADTRDQETQRYRVALQFTFWHDRPDES